MKKEAESEMMDPQKMKRGGKRMAKRKGKRKGSRY